MNAFNQVNWYKFEIDGKSAIVRATSVMGAVNYIKKELGNVKYNYQGRMR